MAMSVDTLLHRHSNPDTPLSAKKCLYIVIYVKAVSTVEEAGGCQAHEITWALKKPYMQYPRNVLTHNEQSS